MSAAPVSAVGSTEHDVYPTHILDDAKGARNLAMGWLFRIDAPLDVGVLCDGLRRVLQDAGRLEIHVPRTFTEDRPPFTVQHVDHSDVLFDDDDERRAFPKATKSAAVFDMTEASRDYMFAADAPKSAQDYVDRQLPQLGLRITSFQDVTMVVVTYPHTAMDGAAQRELMAAWSLALAGREDEIKPVLGAREDVIWKLAGEATEDSLQPSIRRSRELTGLGKISFLARMAWQQWRAPPSSYKMFYLPRDVLARWRDEADDAQPASDKDDWVSDNDLISAWLVQLAAAESGNTARPHVVWGAINARPKFAETRDPRGVYLQNLLSYAWSLIPAGDVTSGSIVRAARAHRREMKAQAEPDQMLHFFRDRRAEVEAGNILGGMKFHLPKDAVFLLCNNLSGLGISAAVDFGPAVLPNADGTRSSGAATHSHFGSSRSAAYPKPAFICLDADEGGYRIAGAASEFVWRKIRSDIGLAASEA